MLQHPRPGLCGQCRHDRSPATRPHRRGRSLDRRGEASDAVVCVRDTVPTRAPRRWAARDTCSAVVARGSGRGSSQMRWRVDAERIPAWLHNEGATSRSGDLGSFLEGCPQPRVTRQRDASLRNEKFLSLRFSFTARQLTRPAPSHTRPRYFCPSCSSWNTRRAGEPVTSQMPLPRGRGSGCDTTMRYGQKSLCHTGKSYRVVSEVNTIIHH
jgi:hypothetical protein